VNEALLKSAVSLHQAGDLAGAARLYEAILRASPRHFQALYLLGFIHFQRGQFGQAEQLIGDAIAINPLSPDAFYNRGCALQGLQRHDEALRCFDQAVALKPDYDEAWTNRGVALLALRRHADALASFDCALVLKPRDREALSNRGTTLFELKRYEESGADYEALLSLDRDFAYARGTAVLCRAYCCDWRSLSEDRARLHADVQNGRPALSPHASTLISDSPQDQLLSARNWVQARCPPAAAPLWRGERYRHDKIRLAYLSADFHSHATAFLAAGLFECHDRKRFETVAVSFGPDDKSAMRARLSRAFDRFLDVRENNDSEVAGLLKDMEIDIAVDLKGFTQDARPSILAFRPAPLQLNYLGHPGTMGAPYIDYIVADRMIIPAGHEAFYSEKIVYLPDSYQCNDSRRVLADEKVTRAQAGLPEAAFVFCCFNRNYKIAPDTFALWMRLLRDVPSSVLWLLEDNPDAGRNLEHEAEAHGIASGRLVFAPRVSAAEHLARHRLADLFLDTQPYGAHTTASDALWTGLPVLTAPGPTFASRVAASLLNAVGLPELIVDSLSAYEAMALHLARHPDALAAMKTKLAANRDTSPLFDTARFTRNLEAAYVAMWQRRQRGEPPRSFSVEPRRQVAS